MPRPNWSRALPRVLDIPGVMTLRTLADVRTLIGHLPKATRARDNWQHVARTLDEAAHGADPVQVEAMLWIVCQLEGVACRPK
jgi:hypothetical protein